MFRYYRV